MRETALLIILLIFTSLQVMPEIPTSGDISLTLPNFTIKVNTSNGVLTIKGRHVIIRNLALIVTNVALAKKHGLYVVPDFHQWHWEPRYQGCGMPTWVVPNVPNYREASVIFFDIESIRSFLRCMVIGSLDALKR